MTTDVGIPQELIERSILLVRGQKVMLDEDLAELYGVEIRVLNQAVKRNSKRFPDDFMFQLAAEEYTECQALRSHFVSIVRLRSCKCIRLHVRDVWRD
jgi:hypothetical protein